MALARSENSPQRFYSMSAQIRQERNAYYDILEGNAERAISTSRLGWNGFWNASTAPSTARRRSWQPCFRKARVLGKARRRRPLNDRQRDILNRLLDGFDGKLTSSKWAKLEKSSPDTALRDITDLLERGILKKDAGGGRSTSYSLVES